MAISRFFDCAIARFGFRRDAGGSWRLSIAQSRNREIAQ